MTAVMIKRSNSSKNRSSHRLFLYGIKTAVLAGIFLSAGLFFSCRSTSEIEETAPDVDPLALLEKDCSLYVCIPAAANKDFVVSILMQEFPELKAKDAELLVSHVDRLYAGIGSKDDDSRMEIAAIGDFPRTAVKMALTKKNGWNVEPYTASDNGIQKTITCYSRADSQFTVAFPSNKILCASRRIKPLLDAYTTIPVQAELAAHTRWITKQSNDILFYMTEPGTYMSRFLGEDVKLGVKTVAGSMRVKESKPAPQSADTKPDFTCLLDMNILLSQSRMMRPMLALLGLSFGGMDLQFLQTGETTIKVMGLPLSEERIYRLFGSNTNKKR